MKKHERLQLIKEIVLSNEIETQHDLLEILKEQNASFTQATISRDMNEIGIVKIPNKDGRYIYGISKEIDNTCITPKQIKNPIIDVKQSTYPSKGFLHLNVVPGNSMLMKRVMIEKYTSYIFSILTDDDSLLVLASDEAASDYLFKELQSWDPSI